MATKSEPTMQTVEAAESHFTDLLARAGRGDTAVTVQMIEDAQEAIDQATRRAEAEQTVAAARKEAERRQRIEELTGSLDEYAMVPEFEQAERELRESLRGALEAFDRVYQSRRTIIREFESLSVKGYYGQSRTSVADGIGTSSGQVTVQGRSVRSEHPESTLRRIVAEEWRAHVGAKQRQAMEERAGRRRRQQTTRIEQSDTPRSAA